MIERHVIEYENLDLRDECGPELVVVRPICYVCGRTAMGPECRKCGLQACAEHAFEPDPFGKQPNCLDCIPF